MAEKVKDLVCGMEIKMDEVAATYEYQGKTYYFCAPGCKRQFEQDPEKYIGKEAEGKSHPHHH
ncbi:MAG: YHS domain-containing protein [Candidatus Bipolaricaulia bacterium]